MKYFLKLRSNIVLEGDIQLAFQEVDHLFETTTSINVQDIKSIPSFMSETQFHSNVRSGEIVGFISENPKVNVDKLALYLSFIQEIWCQDSSLSNKPYATKVNYAVYCAIPMMAMSEYLSYVPKITSTTISDIVCSLAGSIATPKSLVKALGRVNTSSPHVHSFHKYKAKFFPRFVRSLIVSNMDLSKDNYTVCDPYVGSGTTLVECSLMGIDSFGYDIDSLSCFISEAKATSLNIGINDLPVSIPIANATNPKNMYSFPEDIQKKFRRWDTLDEMHTYEKEISTELDLINNEIGFYKVLNQIALSDALTRKFTIRMMGTGSGRFALEIGKKSLQSLLKGNMKTSIHALDVISKLKGTYNLNIKQGLVIHGNATNRSSKDNCCDIIVTSPPYLPASSGREDYLVGKMISLKALGLYDDKELIMTNSVGSMSFQDEVTLEGLPKSVSDLYNWLINDELRCIKAAPIVSYYHSIKKSLLEDKRTLKDDGTIIYIIGKESIFYSNTTKEILYKVECDNIFKEIAESIGLKVKKVINIELDKKNAVARPRSSDKYYESAVIMTKQ